MLEKMGVQLLIRIINKPHQKQPILVIASKEQSTGKSTLLNFDRMLFGCNAVIINVSQYSQQFNGLFASKLLIGIDETIISEVAIKERLKQDSTATEIQLRKMHQEHQTIPFYGKFTLCTNKETDFARLEEDDMRFWIRKVGTISKYDPDFEKKIEHEIPCFLHFLLNREMSVPIALSRQWFSKEQLITDALTVVLENSRSDCAKDILIWAEDKLAEKHNVGFGIIATKLFEEMNRKYPLNVLQKTLKEELKIDNSNKRYTTIYNESRNGRAYLFGDNAVSEEEKPPF